jgi:NitT/TauT family transport system substrate-binding protein
VRVIPWLVLLQATLTVATAGPATAPEYLPLWVAQGEGYFAEEKLAVKLDVARAEAPAAEALAHGRADLAATSLEAALTLGTIAGVPPKLVFGLAETAAVALLVPTSKKDSIGSLGDLVGETVGVPAPGTPADFMLRAILANAGLRPSQLKLKSYGDRGLAGALDSGSVAAGMLGDPYATRLIEEGKAVALVDLRQREGRERWIGEPGVYSALFARADAQLAPAELKSLARALLRAVSRIEAATPEELRASLPTPAVGGQDDWRARLEGARQIFVKNGLVTPQVLGASIRMVREHGPIPTRVKMPRGLDALLMTGPLEEALASGRP